MHRPGLIITAAVLSGILCGLNEISFVWKGILLLITTGMLFAVYMKSRGKSRKPLLFLSVLCLFLFAVSFFRAGTARLQYEAPEVKEYLRKYEATNPGEFDYSSYLKAMGVKNETERKKLKERNRETETSLEEILNDISENASLILDCLYDQEDAGILKAMLLGNKTSMEAEVKSLYQDAGISHLLAVSGLHISMVGMSTYRLIGKLGITGAVPKGIIASAVTAAYTLLTGAQASAVRAAIMLIMGFTAVCIGKKSDGFTTLSLAAVLLLIYRPYLIIYSGFQLSFAAMAGVYAAQAVTGKLPENLTARKSMISCILISVFTLPVIAACYYKAPLYAVLLNLIVIPLMTFVFVSGALSVFLLYAGNALFFGTASGIFRIAAGIVSVPARYLLWLYRKLSALSLKLPFSQIITGKPSEIRIVIYYAVIFVIIAVLVTLPEKFMKRIPVLIAVCYLFSFPLIITRENSSCYVRTLDVGQGDCFHIRSGNTNIVIDCGSSGSESAGSRILEPYLMSKGIEKIDVMILTHADSDHTNGIEYILGNDSCIKTDTVVFPAMAESDERYDKLRETAGERRKVYALQNDRFDFSDGCLRCIYSETSGGANTETNRQSSVWLLRLKNFTMLFTGDITEEEEKKIISRREELDLARNIDILKTAHHGSKTATCSEFLDEFDFDYAVLSYGKNNRYKHPAEETVQKLNESGAVILSTAEQGSICFRISGKEYGIETWN